MTTSFIPLDELPISEGTVDFLSKADRLVISVPPELHVETKRLIQAFAEVMASKLRAAEQEHGFTDNWLRDNWEAECRRQLDAHIIKGDPRDVAIYAAFMWARGWPTARPAR